jgi:hypothetical protein
MEARASALTLLAKQGSSLPAAGQDRRNAAKPAARPLPHNDIAKLLIQLIGGAMPVYAGS